MEINGVLRGIVTDNKDPQKLGRIRVRIPALSGSQESNWARISVWMGGKQMGAFSLPEIGDEVLLAFEQGDTACPYVIGVLWNKKNTPPLTNEDGKNNLRMIKSKSGHMLKFDDTEQSEKIEIVDKSGKNSIVFDAAHGTITIKSDQDIQIEAPNGTIKLRAAKIEMNSDKDTKVKSNGLDLDGSPGAANLKGTTVNIN